MTTAIALRIVAALAAAVVVNEMRARARRSF